MTIYFKKGGVDTKTQMNYGELLYSENTKDKAEIVRLKPVPIVGFIMLGMVLLLFVILPIQWERNSPVGKAFAIGMCIFVFIFLSYIMLFIFSISELCIYTKGIIVPNRGIVNWLNDKTYFIGFEKIKKWGIRPHCLEFQFHDNKRFRLPFTLIQKGKVIPLLKERLKLEPYRTIW